MCWHLSFLCPLQTHAPLSYPIFQDVNVEVGSRFVLLSLLPKMIYQVKHVELISVNILSALCFISEIHVKSVQPSVTDIAYTVF